MTGRARRGGEAGAGECVVREEHGWRVVQVSGELDLSWSAEVRRAILGGLDRRQGVLVELSAVSYIDSSGVASFVEGFQRARQLKLQFGLVAASPAVLAVLKLARLDGVFPLHADLAAARGGNPAGG